MRFKRSDFASRIVSVLPVDNLEHNNEYYGRPKGTIPKFGTEFRVDGRLKGWNFTTLDTILQAKEDGRRLYMRMDILLYNDKAPCKCSCGNRHTKTVQRLVHPGPNGTLVGMPDEEDQEWALEESKKIWEEALANKDIMDCLKGNIY